MNYLEIPALRLLAALSLILLAALLSRLQKLALERDLAIGSLRAAIQLIAIGYALVFVFQHDSPLLVAPVLTVMLAVAAWTASQRVESGPGAKRLFPLALASIGVSSLVAIVPVLAFIIEVKPFLAARYYIPIGGMMLASSMNVVAMVFERILNSVRQQTALIEQALALGAFPSQAIAPMRSQALRAAMIPTINGLLTVGLVQLPGMMTGQILSGTSPIQAVRYQLVIMYQLVAVASVSGALAAFLLQGVLFDNKGRLLRWPAPSEKS